MASAWILAVFEDISIFSNHSSADESSLDIGRTQVTVEAPRLGNRPDQLFGERGEASADKIGWLAGRAGNKNISVPGPRSQRRGLAEAPTAE